MSALPPLIGVFLTIFVGFRYEIGVDWLTYEIMFLDIARMSFFEAISYGDAAYSLINWGVDRFGGQVWHVNLICAAIFCYGLIRFCNVLPQPGLALAVSIPMLVVVTSMGYTRQAAAVGCIMIAFTHFRGTIHWRWVAWLSLAILFHRSAIFVFPLFVIAGSKKPILSMVVGGGAALVLLFAVVLQNIGDVLSLYFEGDLESSGAIPRILVGAAAGAAFLFVKRGSVLETRYTLVRNMAIALIALLPIYFVIPSTTVVDRIGILLLPFQGAVLAAFVASFRQKPVIEAALSVAIVLTYAGLFFVWLLYSSYNSYWIPYENVLFIDQP